MIIYNIFIKRDLKKGSQNPTLNKRESLTSQIEAVAEECQLCILKCGFNLLDSYYKILCKQQEQDRMTDKLYAAG